MFYMVDLKVKLGTNDSGEELWGLTNFCSLNCDCLHIAEKIVKQSTGLLFWKRGNIGLCTDVMPKIEAGLKEFKENPEEYLRILKLQRRKYKRKRKSSYFLDTPYVFEYTVEFFEKVLNEWEEYKTKFPDDVNRTYLFLS